MRLGADPEVFTIDKQTGKFKSIIGRIGADKWNPLQIAGMPVGFTLQEDNVALEFGIPPASTSEEFVRHIQAVMKKGLSKLPDRAFSNLSCVVFPDEEVSHPLAKIFGCEPDFNAWTGKENEKPVPPHPGMRSAGGHIHVETSLQKDHLIRCMDLFLGVPSVLMDEGTERRKLYGSAGCYRPKPYGVEYRTLSNFWIFDKKLIKWAWDNSERAHQELEEDDGFWHEADWLSERVQKCINNGDKKLAEKLVKEFDLNVV